LFDLKLKLKLNQESRRLKLRELLGYMVAVFSQIQWCWSSTSQNTNINIA